ncbi:PLP-dependent aminotransferase family protein [Saccharopolyspora taberi]|uniref:PLP-dependent aminotransferase family protein n=1 Tax=Saccharopolyspora taberi TaxID=60895 RepID=A0ABN3VIB5_9PSEU
MPIADVDQFAVLIRDRLRAGRGPLGRRLAESLTELAESGVLAPGTRLPSERDLARALDCTRGAVAAAFNALCDAGVCERRHGSGTFLTGAEPRSAGGSGLARLLRPGAVLADLSTSVVPDPSHLVVPGIDPAELMRTPSRHGYDARGEPRLVALLRERTGADVLVTNGAQHALDLAVRCFARPGDAVLVEDPTYPGALAAIQRSGARAVPVATDRGGMVPEALSAAIARHRPAFAVTMAVHNPAGTAMPAERAGRLAAIARAEDVLVVEDRTLADLVHTGEPPGTIAAGHPHGTIRTHSLSKVLWGGLRVGWISAAAPLLARLTELRQDSDLAGSSPSQQLAAILLQHNEIQPWRAELARRRDHLAAALRAAVPEWTWELPPGGMSLWVRLPGTDTDRFAETAREHGVAVAPGSLFSADGRFRDHLRLSFALTPELLDRAVAGLTAAWQAATGGRDH